MKRPSGAVVRRLVGFASWTSFDQLLFSLSNLVIVLAVARGGGVEELGRFSVAFAVYLVVLGFMRSFVAEPVLTLSSRADDHGHEPHSLTLMVALAAAAAVGVSGLGMALARPELVVVGATLPLTLGQDLLRYQAFRRKKPAIAALLDGGWVATSLACWPLLLIEGTAVAAALCWSLGAVVGLVLGAVAMRPRLTTLAASWCWWKRNARVIAGPLLLDSALVTMSSQGVIFVLALMAGDDQVGLLRAAQVFFAPLGLALTAFGVVTVPFFAQRRQTATARNGARLSAVVALVTVGVSGVLVVGRPVVQDVLFGSAVAVSLSLLIPAALAVVSTAAAAGFVVVTKAQQRGGDIVRSRLLSAVVGVVGFLWATHEFGVVGSAWALVAQAAWYAVHIALRTRKSDRASARSDEARCKSVA